MKRILTAAAITLTTSLVAGAALATPYWVDNGITLNARSGPGTNYHVLGSFPPCTKVHVIAHQHGWAKLSYNNGYYWVSAKYLQNHACNTGYHQPAPKKKSGGYNNY
ncbi:SH3 domain-containing protein [Tropicibacter oceani]|uniref:SH3 domain-containing protein n=1 Tax=Tropicibacter oceani TaxID=3058420 RepID=A0ABY8QFI4_9RHOB|nr:SH3 domain-containing protein [Tropicibacter oceani]WGW02957.1 SH3 domain-containing protein [Tropicibacter oceani]